MRLANKFMSDTRFYISYCIEMGVICSMIDCIENYYYYCFDVASDGHGTHCVFAWHLLLLLLLLLLFRLYKSRSNILILDFPQLAVDNLFCMYVYVHLFLPFLMWCIWHGQKKTSFTKDETWHFLAYFFVKKRVQNLCDHYVKLLTHAER